MYASVKGIPPAIANDITTSIDEYEEAIKNADDDDKKDINIEDYIKDKDHLQIFYDSKSYQGIIEQAKAHACGFILFNGNPREKDVVGYGDIRYEIGLIRCFSEATGKSTIVANVEGGLLDSYGYVKDDFLIVDVVGIIYKLYHSIGREVPTVAELRQMVTGNDKVWDLYAKGQTCCLNQCEKAGTTKKVMQYKPKNIKELAAFIAGIRPGFKSLINGFLNRVVYSNGEPAIDKLLEDSFNYMLYQEAVMKIFSYLGIPIAESYDTIKKISKKKLVGEALAKVEGNLKTHWLQNIGNLDNFDTVYNVIKDSARYSFNAPHALSMALDSLYEAWFKAHYPGKFYEVTLNHYQQKGNKNKVAELQQEAIKTFGFSVAMFAYGQDNTRFVVDEEKKIIYPSLASIKGIGDKAVSELYNIYQSGKTDFIDIYMSTFGSSINKSVFTKLISIGYFSQFGTIKKLLAIIDLVDDWRTSSGAKKTISKKAIGNLNIDEETLRLYCSDVSEKTGKVSANTYRICDWEGLIRAMANNIPDDEYPLTERVKTQLNILGYVDYKSETLSPRYFVVTNLDTKYSPRFEAYCLNNGATCVMKVHKSSYNRKDKEKPFTSFAGAPFSDGDILYLQSWSKEPKKVMIDGKWTDAIDGSYDVWLNQYSVVKNM